MERLSADLPFARHIGILEEDTSRGGLLVTVKTANLPTYRQIAGFFLPLSLTSLIITLSHSVVNAGVARTPDPEVALAAYALARSLVMLIENPMFMVRQTAASLIRDMQSFLQVRRFVYILSGLITGLLAVLAFTPLGYWALADVMGASDAIAEQANTALMVLFLLPVFTVSRNLYHGVAIIARQTLLVPLSTLVRLMVMSGVVFGLAHWTNLPGAVSASFAFTGAFLVESTIMRWKARPLLRTGTFFARKTTNVQLRNMDISRFFFPLVITTFVATSFGPLINTGLARTDGPEIALAAYSVGHGLAMMLLAPIGMLHQCTLTFTKVTLPETFRMTKRFTGGFAVLASVLMVWISFTGAGPWILTHLMGVTPAVRQAALGVMQVMSILPLLFGWREYLWGILMQHRATKLIGAGKAVNLFVVVLSLLVLLAAGIRNPASAGAWAMVLGELADCIVLQFYYRRTDIYAQRRQALLLEKDAAV